MWAALYRRSAGIKAAPVQNINTAPDSGLKGAASSDDEGRAGSYEPHQNLHCPIEEEMPEGADEACASPGTGQDTPQESGRDSKDEDCSPQQPRLEVHGLSPERHGHAGLPHHATPEATALHGRVPDKAEENKQHAGPSASTPGQLHLALRSLMLDREPEARPSAEAPASQATIAEARQSRSMHNRAAARKPHGSPSISSTFRRKHKLTFSAPPFAHKVRPVIMPLGMRTSAVRFSDGALSESGACAGAPPKQGRPHAQPKPALGDCRREPAHLLHASGHPDKAKQRQGRTEAVPQFSAPASIRRTPHQRWARADTAASLSTAIQLPPNAHSSQEKPAGGDPDCT